MTKKQRLRLRRWHESIDDPQFDPRDNPPPGYVYECIVTPLGDGTYYNGLAKRVHIGRDDVLVTRRVDNTSYWFTPSKR